MIQTAWMDRVLGSLKLNREPDTGTVVGFVQGQSRFRVSLEEKSVGPSTRIVYFNQRGEVTRDDHGEPGGGFILMNMPEGFRTVAIQPEGTAKFFSTAILVESKVINVISHWIR
jgi:hypothetical protein